MVTRCVAPGGQGASLGRVLRSEERAADDLIRSGSMLFERDQADAFAL